MTSCSSSTLFFVAAPRPQKELMRAAALLSRLGRMPLNDALAYSYDDVLMWIEELVEAESALNGA